MAEDKRWLLMYLFGHSGLLLDVLLLDGNQRPETSLHLEDGVNTHSVSYTSNGETALILKTPDK